MVESVLNIDGYMRTASKIVTQLLPDEKKLLNQFNNEEKVESYVRALNQSDQSDQSSLLRSVDNRLRKVIQYLKLVASAIESLAPSRKDLESVMWDLFGVVISVGI